MGVRGCEKWDDVRLRLGLCSSDGEPSLDLRRSGIGVKLNVSPRRVPASVNARLGEGRVIVEVGVLFRETGWYDALRAGKGRPSESPGMGFEGDLAIVVAVGMAFDLKERLRV
jgi:hypothetical protein